MKFITCNDAAHGHAAMLRSTDTSRSVLSIVKCPGVLGHGAGGIPMAP